MSDFDEKLRQELAARADAVAIDDDWDGLLDRLTRRARRTNRALASALVITLCVSTVAVVVAARGSGPAATNSATKSKAAGGDGVDATHAAVPTVALAGSQTFGKVVSAAPLTSDAAGVTTFVASKGQFLAVGPGAMDMARVFTRTTPGGVTIRAYRTDVAGESMTQGPPWWTPPGWCFPSGYMQADVSNAAMTGIGFSPLYAEFNGAKVGGTVTVAGQNEKAVQWIVVAQGPADAARLRVTFPDGSHDEMAPVDGVAVLVGGGPAEGSASATLTALDASGAAIGATLLSPNVLSVPPNMASCVAPQALPAPGKQQPADVAAARAAVADAFAQAYAKGIDDAGFRAAFDDSHGFAEVQQELFTGTFKEQVKAAVQTLDDVVFLSPTTAAIKYHIDVPDYSTFANRFNEVHLVDGHWKLSREGWCRDVSLAGIQCPK